MTDGAENGSTLLEEGFLEALFGDDREAVREVVGVARVSLVAQVDAVEAACHRGDASGLRRAFHTLKGALAQLGARSAQARAAALEAGAFDDPRRIAAEVESLRREVDAVLELLTARYGCDST